MFRIRKLVFCFVATLFCISVFVWQSRADAGEQSGGKLIITGSSTMCPMISEMGRQFTALHRDVRIEVQCGGSDRGIRDLREGKSDIGMIARALTDKENDMYGFPMARDGVSIIINKDNPVKSLSNEQVIGIFAGRITRWKQVGGPDGPISVILREKQKPVTEIFENYYRLNKDIRGRVLPGDNPVTINAVASQLYAVGYVSSGEAGRKAASGVSIKVLPVNNVMPTDRNIITGNYPLARALTLITRGLPSGQVKEFINYCLSPKAVDTIKRFDFVPYED